MARLAVIERTKQALRNRDAVLTAGNMSRKPKQLAFIAGSLVVSAWCSGCSTITGEDFATVPGVISSGSITATRVIVAPDTVRAGERFIASISTFGSGSCTRPTSSTSYLGGSLADISVWDRLQVSGICTSDLKQFPRDVSIVFTTPGLATIRVNGQALARAANGQDSLVVIEKRVVVQ